MTGEQRVVRIPVYWLVVGLCVMIVTPIFTLLAATTIANNNARRIVAEQERQKQAAQEEARRVACSFFSASLDAFAESPPINKTGKALQENYLDFYRISGCQPPRTK